MIRWIRANSLDPLPRRQSVILWCRRFVQSLNLILQSIAWFSTSHNPKVVQSIVTSWRQQLPSVSCNLAHSWGLQLLDGKSRSKGRLPNAHDQKRMEILRNESWVSVLHRSMCADGGSQQLLNFSVYQRYHGLADHEILTSLVYGI